MIIDDPQAAIIILKPTKPTEQQIMGIAATYKAPVHYVLPERQREQWRKGRPIK